MVKPIRIQLSRRKGFRLVSPNGLPIVIVDRRSEWGNPFSVKAFGRDEAVRRFTFYLNSHFKHWTLFRSLVREKLRGRNLACWCALGEKCHADVLLIVANSEP